MITALDHVVLLCPEIEAGAKAYETLLGTGPAWRAQSGGAATAVFHVGNTALELMAPFGDGETANKLAEMTRDGARLTSLVFRSDDLDEDHRILTRRGLTPSDPGRGESTDIASGARRTWSRFRVPDNAMAGIKTFVLAAQAGELPKPPSADGRVSGLDHLVIKTPNPDRAVANYAGRLGLRLALDRSSPDWGTRLVFFRVGGLTLEMMHPLEGDADPNGPDEIWGLSWQVRDAGAARNRLLAAGLEVSDTRPGRKAGTTVFSVKTRTLGVPTLFIGHQPR